MMIAYRKIIFSTIGFSLFFLAACNQIPSSSKNIRPSQSTNEIAQSNLNLGIAYMKEGNYEKALDKLNKAKDADPGHSPIYNVFGLLYQQLGQDDKAEQNFKRAISLNSSDSRTLNNYGRFLCQQNRVEDAEDIFLKAADNPLYDAPEIAITNAGLCLDNHGQNEKALEYYKKALALNPQMPQALLKVSEANLNESDYLSARTYLQRYQKIARHTPKSLWLGIQIENQLGDIDTVSSYALLLKNTFPESNEARLLHDSGIQ